MPLADGVRGPDIDRIFVFWSPEACIADSMADDGLSKVVSGNTQVSRALWQHVDARRAPVRVLLRVACDNTHMISDKHNEQYCKFTLLLLLLLLLL